ncbi:hypothetical protein HPP92_019476 [Vanilla planifolia]|uniref:Uncharacterized protein n=1 Tax=Vanilla planifolia TaxID=51239 RepID=A0A835Q8W9_VANPL|nr:hypothetical protein HPP92_019476 [Vanilla planifolia]
MENASSVAFWITVSVFSKFQQSVNSLQRLQKVDNQAQRRECIRYREEFSNSSDKISAGSSVPLQFQAMKRADLDSSRVSVKRLKGTNIWEGGEKRANVSGVFTGGELVSHGPTAFAGQHELQNNSMSRGSAFSLTGGNECHTINPQMAVTWFDPYGTFKGNQTSDK